MNYEISYYTEIEPEIITLKSDKRYYVAGMVSTISPDLANDVITMDAQKQLYTQIKSAIDKGGFITGDLEHMVFYDEKGQALEFPKVRDERGNLIIPEIKFVDVELKSNGVWAKAEVNRYHPNFRTIWKSIEEGFLNGFSIAVRPLEKITKRLNGVMTDFVSSLKLINITLTGTPCNTDATMAPVLKSYLNRSDNMLKHKYIRREGSAGDYTYYYKDAEGKETSSKDEPQDDENPSHFTHSERAEIADKVKKEASSKQLKRLENLTSEDERKFLKLISKEELVNSDTIQDALDKADSGNNKESSSKEDKEKMKDNFYKDIKDGMSISKLSHKYGFEPSTLRQTKEYGFAWGSGKSMEESMIYSLEKNKGAIAEMLRLSYYKEYDDNKDIIKKTNTYQNKTGDIMEDTELKSAYEKLTDAQKKEYDALDSDDAKKEYLAKCNTDTDTEKKSTEAKEDSNPEDKSVELKSELTILKSEFVVLKSELEKSNTANTELKSQITGLNDRLAKIEGQTIKKSLASDKSVMLGVDSNIKLSEKSVFDLL